MDNNYKEFTVSEFKKPETKNVEETGELDLHSHNGAAILSGMQGTPVDVRTVPEPEITEAPAVPQPEVTAPAKGKGRILIVVPILQVSFEFFESFLKFWQEITLRQAKGLQTKYEIGYHFIHRKPVHIAETNGAMIALRNKCTHVLYMDDDIYDITPEMLDALYDADKDVISGVMYASGFPYAMCTFRRYDTQTTVSSQPAQKGLYRLYEIPCRCPHCFTAKKIVPLTWNSTHCPECRKDMPSDFAIQKVDLIPFPFTLIKTSVFNRIELPWFHCNTVFPTDSWFADRCIKAGIQEYAHMNVRLNHRGVTDATKPFKFQESLAQAQSKSSVIRLTQEQMALHTKVIEAKMNMAEERMKVHIRPEFS